MNDKVYLWINLADLDAIGTVGPFGSPLKMMVQPSLGDELLDVSVFDRNRIDNMFVLVHCTPERAEAIKGGMEVVGKRKLLRKPRSRVTKNLPMNGKKWHISNQ